MDARETRLIALNDKGYYLGCGDMLDLLNHLEDNSVDSCVTDPPYGLSFMGKKWDYDVPTSAQWAAVYRVLKPGAHLLSFFSARTYHRGVVQVEDAGFDVRDQVQWIYGSGFPKSSDVCKAVAKTAESVDEAEQWSGWGTALKPANEPIVLARKPLIGTVAENVLEYGTGGLNIDGCRVCDAGPSPSVLRRQNKAPGQSIGATGWVTAARPASYNEQRKGELLGRWPANLIHDGSDEVLAHFPDAKGQQGAINGSEPSAKTKNCFGDFAGRTPCKPRKDKEVSAARFFYCAKTSRNDRNSGGVNNKHPTVKPTDLMRYLCRLVTPTGGVVLDPFAGSGSTGIAALLEGFRFIGFEQDVGYTETARQRLEAVYD